MMDKRAKIYVAGHRGLVGSAIVRALQADGFSNLILRTHAELDLTSEAATREFFEQEQPEYVFLAAAKVGGIHANNVYPVQFIRDNLAIQSNVIHSAYLNSVKRLMFLGSSCIYPKQAPQPMLEEYLLTGPLEPTNRPYALAKISGIEMCWSYNRQYGTRYISAMPTNMYGPGDNYHLENSHVIPAMIRKFHLARLAADGDLQSIVDDENCYGRIPSDIREMIGLSGDAPITARSVLRPVGAVRLWGSGTPLREFLYSDDLGAACVHLMNLPESTYHSLLYPAGEASSERNLAPLVNIGFGSDATIRELADAVAKTVGYQGAIEFDASKPDGTMRKLMDSTKIRSTGWAPQMSLDKGLASAYKSYQAKYMANVN